MTELNHPAGKSQELDTNLAAQIFGHPDDVVNDRRLTMSQKRALLASWASDANAVPHVPWLRQLPDGSIVNISEILQALQALDGKDAAAPACRDFWKRPRSLSSATALRKWLRNGRRGPDDEDDPPPCPASAARPPRGNDGGAFALPEPLVA